MEMARVRVLVSGLVQGVAFRAYTRQEAISLGLSGWVRNRSDGQVEIVAEGPRAKLEALVAWCHRGPPAAMVDEVTVSYEEPQGESGAFWIRR